ncbi:hypothetical protein [Flavobacterium sp.]|uniref:hypothetical protein n=1 Tax=Flavobacterium sp. TaxID=239 RepID=UPI003D6AE529
MQSVLAIIRLCENYVITIPMNLSDFTQKLEEVIDDKNADPFSLFGPGSKNNFKGTFNTKGFKLQSTLLNKRNKAISMNIKGALMEEGNTTKIAVEIKADDFFTILYLSFSAFMAFLLVLSFFLDVFEVTQEHHSVFNLFFMIAIPALFFFSYYFHIRRNMKIVKYELIKIFQNLTKN